MTDTFGPYTPVRRAGNLYFVSGQVGVDVITQKADTNITKQTKQALKNLQNALAAASLDVDDVVKVTVFLTDMNNLAAMNEAYEAFFAVPRPARSTVAVKELPPLAGDTPLLVEIEAVAVRGGNE